MKEPWTQKLRRWWRQLWCDHRGRRLYLGDVPGSWCIDCDKRWSR